MRMAGAKTKNAALEAKLEYIKTYQASTLPSFCWRKTTTYV